MRVILDTNVFISGVFFTGPPYKILKAWRDGKLTLVLSPEILQEYHRVGQALAKSFPGVDVEPILHLFHMEAQLQKVPELMERICDDPDDDKFLACAIGTKTMHVISGDKNFWLYLVTLGGDPQTA